MASILVYVRPWNSEQFQDLAGKIWQGYENILVSEHHAVDQHGLSEAFYRALSTISENTASPELSEADITDVILRCRLLRAQDIVTARKYVLAMNEAIKQIMDEHQPVATLSVTVDSYIIHLISLACQRRKIPFIGLVPTFVNGYFRITALGERVWSREVTVEEVTQVYKKLFRPDYRPSFLVQDPNAVRRTAIRRWMRNLPKPLWFSIKRRFTGDKLNYHYCATQLISSRYWSILPQSYQGVRPKKRTDLVPNSSSKPLIFLPLQMSPEATIDYWSTDTSWIDYETKVLKLLDEYRETTIFAVKEHPNVLGNRTKGFYKRLQERKNCILISPEFASNALIDMCDGVVICTGTVGFEAALRGLTVYSDSAPFHLENKNILSVNELDSSSIGNHAVGESDAMVMIKYLLEGLLPGNFINDGSWNKNWQKHKNMNSEIAKQIISMLNKKSI